MKHLLIFKFSPMIYNCETFKICLKIKYYRDENSFTNQMC